MKRIISVIAFCAVLNIVNAFNYAKFASVSPSGHTLYYEISSDGGIPNGGAWVTCENLHYDVHYSSTTPAYNNISGHIVIPDSVEYNGVMYAVTSVGDCAFTRCANITSVTLPAHIVHFGYSSFEGCTKLSSITIPEAVYEIGKNAFKHCDSLHTVYFNAINCANGTWGNDIFKESNNIETVYVGRNVTHLPSYLFAACNQLPNIYFYSVTPPTMVVNVFPGNKNITAHVPCSSLSIYTSTLSGQDGAIFSFQCFSLFDLMLVSNDSTWGVATYAPLSDSMTVINATANYGYHFSHWTSGSTANPDTIVLSRDTVITAFFAKKQYVVAGAAGDSTLGWVMGSATVDYLDTVTLTAMANPHYHFVCWDDGDTANPRQIVATGNIEIIASFAIDTHTVVLQVDSVQHGVVQGGGSFLYGTADTITALPYSGYHFSHWSDGAVYNPYTFAVVEDKLLTAIFIADGQPWQDTIVVHDTIFIPIFDTLWLTDTVYIHDTIYISNEGIDNAQAIQAKIYNGKGSIIVEGAEGVPVMLFDAVGRQLAVRREEINGRVLFGVPSSGVYMVKIGDRPARKVVVVK